MTAPAPVPDGTTPPAEAVEAAYRIDIEHRPASVSVERDSVTCACGHETTERLGLAAHRAEFVAAAVVAALNLPDRDRETAAGFRIAAELTIQDVRAQRGDHIAGLVEDSFAAHFDRASALREGRES